MIVRRFDTFQQLITQPAHAALAARIMREWSTVHFPETARKASILHAVEQHDCGWAGIDETLVVGEATGQVLDFTEVSDDVKRETSVRGIPPLASDPYAAALAAQHRLHVYRRYADDADWRSFFVEITAARDAYLTAVEEASLDQLLRDYWFVRAGDLASLAFCNNWMDTPDDGCGYAMHVGEGARLSISPDPFDGRAVDIQIEARVLRNQKFGSAEEARKGLESAQTITLTGLACGLSR